MLYKKVGFNGSYSASHTTNLKTTISQRSLKYSGLLLLLFEFNNFSFLKDRTDNKIDTSVSREQNSHQWQCSIISRDNVRFHFVAIEIKFNGQ